MRETRGNHLKYYQISVKSIEFLQESATAVYFYDFTDSVKTLQLKEELLRMERQNKSLNLNQMTLSHEFRSPLNSCLMLLESLLKAVTS